MARFGAVGVLNTAVDAAVFTLLYAWAGAPYAAAQTAAYGAGALNSYIWNKRWTFKSRSRANAREWLSFLLVNGLSYGISIAVLAAAYEALGLPMGWSKALSIASSVAFNYIGSRFWVFRSPSAVTMERRES
jgi:putative flippase GtrA